MAPTSNVFVFEQLHILQVQPDEWAASHLLHGPLHSHELLHLHPGLCDHVSVLLELADDVRAALPRENSVHGHLHGQLLPVPPELSPGHHETLLWQRFDHESSHLHNYLLEPDRKLLLAAPAHPDPSLGHRSCSPRSRLLEFQRGSFRRCLRLLYYAQLLPVMHIYFLII